ncbi:MAG: cytochrome b N-terminal domain-containing protein [Chloroflexi bacterium]|nr:cytochrome b N-terminal domain-containing protein [Chloroflexota bacterium]
MIPNMSRPNFFEHLHPPTIPAREARFRYTFGLGGMSMLLFLSLVVTGVPLMFAYVPTAVAAGETIRAITYVAPYGWLLRNLHYWAAVLLVGLGSLHLLRVALSGSYKPPRRLNWLLGLLALLLSLLLSFSGYVLRWDCRHFWRVDGRRQHRASDAVNWQLAIRITGRRSIHFRCDSGALLHLAHTGSECAGAIAARLARISRAPRWRHLPSPILTPAAHFAPRIGAAGGCNDAGFAVFAAGAGSVCRCAAGPSSRFGKWSGNGRYPPQSPPLVFLMGSGPAAPPAAAGGRHYHAAGRDIGAGAAALAVDRSRRERPSGLTAKGGWPKSLCCSLRRGLFCSRHGSGGDESESSSNGRSRLLAFCADNWRRCAPIAPARNRANYPHPHRPAGAVPYLPPGH